MLSSIFLLALQLMGFTLVAAASNTKAPGCVQKCWDNTQYVSPDCHAETSCLCDDTEYQNAVYQCLYSQCHTAQFANALHHTLAMCSAAKSNKGKTGVNVPALLRQGDLKKKRQNQPMMSVSASVGSVTRPTGSVTRSATSRPTQSVTRSAQQSVSASNYMKRDFRRAFPTAAPAAGAFQA